MKKKPITHPRSSNTFDAYTNSEIRRAAQTGIYDIRGGGSKRNLPNFDDLLFLGASISRYPLEGYRETCNTSVILGDRFAKKPIKLDIQITIAGIAKDDQSVVEMMNNLTTLNSVKDTKIETLIGLSEEDRIALYTTEGEAAPKLEDLPKETITKKFTISLKLNSVEGEKFDDKKIYAELLKRTKKKWLDYFI